MKCARFFFSSAAWVMFNMGAATVSIALSVDMDTYPANDHAIRSSDYRVRAIFADSLEEVAVSEKSKLISNGDIMPEENDGTYYGEHDVEAGPIRKTFYIKYTNTINPTKDLLITGLIQSDNSLFEISAQPATKILSPGDSVAFEITLHPEAQTILTPDSATTAYITIPNNIDINGYFLFAVAATITGTVDLRVAGNDSTIHPMDLYPTLADSTFIGDSIDVNNESVTVTYWIYNEGNMELLLDSISSDNPAFSVTQPALFAIPKGDSISFDVTFDPDTAGTASALIFIPNNSFIDEVDDKNPYIFLVQGIGIDDGWIIVKGNAQLIEQGDTTPSVRDHTDMGRVHVGTGTLSRTYWIYNQGSDELTLTGDITLNNPVFTVEQPTELVLLPGDSVSFTVTFDPLELGVATATVVIPNDDEDQHPFTFLIQGEGTQFIEATVKGAGQVIESGDKLISTVDGTDFGRLFTNHEPDTLTHTFWIINTGIDSLFITGDIFSDHSVFSVTQPQITHLAAGDSVSFTVTFSPDAIGEFSALISIPNDDSERNPYTFVVSGEAVLYVEEVHGRPVAVNDTFNVLMEEFLSGNVLTDNGIDTLSPDAPHRVLLAEDVTHGSLILNEDGSFEYISEEDRWGEDRFTYRLCDADQDYSEATVIILIEGEGIAIYDAFSPDGDGVNDEWEIDNIANYVNNRVAIFNRWGSIVWQATNYDNEEVRWNGESNAGLTSGRELPDGTYFYIIEAEAIPKEQGYVVISRKR